MSEKVGLEEMKKKTFCPKCGYEDPVIWHSYRWSWSFLLEVASEF